ncbi:AarF/UbiB family protein [Niabella hibiscisoli]|nr:AarF/UbiB family protein [Niabella hibiscisoli]MCH5715431.1 AarF/UbiB family protein [Niabella hibiscisoli]
MPHIKFPDYYPEYSCEKILTMDWMDGIHFSEYVRQDQAEADRNLLGQTFWDFYMYQLHVLKKLHADPHPGNFLVSADNDLLVIDFGCIKEIPADFYKPYFELADQKNLRNPALFEEKLYELEILTAEDSAEEKAYFKQLFYDLLELFTRPFNAAYFDFSDEAFLVRLQL